MPEILIATCDHCESPIKIKNPDLVGKKIKCPKCEEAFVVKVASGSKSKSSKDAFEDDDDDFEDVPRRRKPVKKTKKRKQSNSHLLSTIGLIAGVVLGLGVMIGGIIFIAKSLPAITPATDTDWTQTEIEAYIKFQVDDIAAAPSISPLMNLPSTRMSLQKLKTENGFEPADVDYLMLAVHTTDGTGGDDNGESVFVTRFKKPMDIRRLAGSAATETSFNGYKYYKHGLLCNFAPDSKTLVVAKEPMMQQLIKRGRSNPSRSRFKQVGNSTDHILLESVPKTPGGGKKTGIPELDQAISEVTGMVVKANFASDVNLEVQATFLDGTIAQSTFVKLNEQLAALRTLVEATRLTLANADPTQNPMVPVDERRKVVDFVGQMTNSIQMTQLNSTITGRTVVPGAFLKQFVEQPMLNPMSQFQGLMNPASLGVPGANPPPSLPGQPKPNQNPPRNNRKPPSQPKQPPPDANPQPGQSNPKGFGQFKSQRTNAHGIV